jgi:protein-tyrosine phosphatase
MIDTHSHLLPGVDHGCPDLTTSVAMARAAWEAGTSTVVCTPHLLDWDPGLLTEARCAFDQVRAALDAEGIGLRLLLGFEVDASVITDVDDAMLAMLAVGDPEADARAGDDALRTAVGGQRGVILVETPFHSWPPFLEESLYRVSLAGYTPVLAHPERNERVQRSPELLENCIRAGAVIQGTAGSLSGPFRRGSLGTFMDLLARGYLHLLASDGHSHVPYTWSLTPLKEELSKRVSAERLDLLMRVNPERVLSGEAPLPTWGTEDKGRTRPWWRR